MFAGEATAIAHPNIALAKYWGKRAYGHNLPAVPSLSVTLAGMSTITTVRFDPELSDDTFELYGLSVPEGESGASPRPVVLNTGDNGLKRVSGLLNRLRERAGLALHAHVTSRNDFPTASGLASSASAFAALAVAAAAALGLALEAPVLSDLARRTSVSSARSIFGGYVELPAGNEGDTYLSALPVVPADHLPLRLVVAVTREGPKDIGSTEGMLHTSRTSVYYPAWIDSAPALFKRIREALLQRDFEALGAAAETSALRMHAAALAAEPGVVYWTGATVRVIEEVRALRKQGIPAFFTIDAGPHVKVLTMPEHEAAVTRALVATPGVLRTIAAKPGDGARPSRAHA